MIANFLQTLKSKDFAGMTAHHQIIPASLADFDEPSPPLPSNLSQALQNLGITNLYSHQVEVLQLVRNGKNPVIITPTASGKTLSYLLPILE
jgi:DEAD/DEAH box helicase domain-containing protein